MMRSVVYIIWVIVMGLLAVQLEKPSDVNANVDSGFSALNVKTHLDSIAKECHFIGTSENRKVKDYIIAEFAKMNIPTELFVGHSQQLRSAQYMRLARTENIIARIKGKSSKKAVLIAGHYDSVLSAPGAADDGHAVACMLEVANLLKDDHLENDIIFWITDGEEMGLLGAQAFVETQDLSHIGLVLNYEARGNSGPSIAFEWSDDNAWLVDQLKTVGKKPVTSSLSYEIYKLLPNDTDFTHFKEAGLTGINHAFIDGFSYYHNPVDNVENINWNSVQHVGENMYLMAKHFGNVDISNTRTHNASFFNFLGGLIMYPSSWDIYLLIMTCFLVLLCLYWAIIKRSMSWLSLFMALVHVLIGLVLVVLLCTGFGYVLMKMYPQYTEFYSGQYYNHKWYLLTVIGVCVLVISLVFKLFIKRNNAQALKVAILLVLLILAVLFYIYIPTGTYFMVFPLVALSLSFLIKGSKVSKVTYANTVGLFVLSIIPIAIWAPVIINIFLAFSLKMLAAPGILTLLLLSAVFICFDSIWSESGELRFFTFAYFGFRCFYYQFDWRSCHIKTDRKISFTF